jgi:transcription termination/antitermination protein NusG
MRPARYNGVVREQGSFEGRSAMKEEQSFKPGDVVEIISGPFAKLTGKVRDVNDDKRMLAVVVKIFGRDTPVELKFREVKKIAS